MHVMDDFSRAAGRFDPPWWAWPFLLYLPLDAWAHLVMHEVARLPHGPAPHTAAAGALVALGVTAQIAATLVETAFYRMLWSARGLRLPFAPLALLLLQASVVEPLAQALLDLAGGRVPAPWLVAVVGARATWQGSVPGGAFAQAFGGLGALALLRVLFAAWAQARLVDRPLREALAAVVAAWLATHLAAAWGLDLLRGPHGIR